MIFSFDDYSKLLDYPVSCWTILSKNNLNEGIRFGENKKIEIDFEKDSEQDLVFLDPPKKANVTRKSGIPVFKGYLIENRPDKSLFAEEIKKWESLSKEDLKKLIDLTYPKELRNANVKVIFVTGSSEPLADNIASAIREMYYPSAKKIDILKAYYGTDITNIVNWEEYEKVDPKTKKMIDSYLNKFRYGKHLGEKPQIEFEGYIKKSSGLQSGARRVLKPGHSIDSVILDAILDSERYWKEFYLEDERLDMSVKVKMMPKYLFVDDIIIEGSTLRGIFRSLIELLDSPEIREKIGAWTRSSIYGYCLFGYKSS